MLILLFDFDSLPFRSPIPEGIGNLLATSSLLGTTASPASLGTRLWQRFWTLTTNCSILERWTQKVMDLSMLFDVVEQQQLPRHFPRWAWSLRTEVCLVRLPAFCLCLLSSPSSQILGAFHLSRFFPWQRDPGSFASHHPSQGNWLYTCHLALSLPGPPEVSVPHSPTLSNSLGFHLLTILIHSLSVTGCFFPTRENTCVV